MTKKLGAILSFVAFISSFEAFGSPPGLRTIRLNKGYDMWWRYWSTVGEIKSEIWNSCLEEGYIGATYGKVEYSSGNATHNYYVNLVGICTSPKN